MFDTLLGRLTPPSPAQIRGVSVELSASGRSVMISETLHSGPPRRHLSALEESQSIFMRFADGREVWVEVRLVEPTPEEDVEPWLVAGTDPEPDPTEPAPQRTSSFACPDFSPR